MADPQESPVLRQRPNPSPQGRMMTQSVEAYSGITPPPAHIEAYERMLPGAAERFMQIAEGEIAHRRNIENEQVTIAKDTAKASRGLAARGQIFAFIIAIVGLGGCVWLGLAGSAVASSIIGGGSLVTIILAFLRGSGGGQK